MLFQTFLREREWKLVLSALQNDSNYHKSVYDFSITFESFWSQFQIEIIIHWR